MAFLKSALASLFCNPESTFGTAASTQYTDYIAVPAEGIELSLANRFVDRPVQTTTLGLHTTGLVGPKGGTVKFRTGIPGNSTAGASGVPAAAQAWLDELLLACAHAKQADTGGVVTGSSSTTTSIVMTDSTGITVGSAVMINGEVRFVTANATNTLTVTPALSAAPAADDVVYAGVRYVTSDTDPGTITLVLKGDGYLYRLLGAKGKVALVDTDAGKRPMLEWEFNIDDHDTSEPSGNVPSRTLSNHIASVIGSDVYWGSTQTVVAGLSFDAGRDLAAKQSTQGTNGRAGWIVRDEKPVAGFKPYFASAYKTDFEATTTRSFLAQIGSAAQNCIALYAHKAQITDGWQPVDVEGNVGHDVKLKVVDPENTSLKPYVWVVF
jgi:hypothetical protein